MLIGFIVQPKYSFSYKWAAFQNGENKDKMVSGASVKITNVSQVRHESQDCLATAVKKKRILQPVW